MAPMSDTLGASVKNFCSTVFSWLSGKLVLGKKEFSEHLFLTLNGCSKSPAIVERINSELHQRGINISLHRAVTQAGPEIRLDHIEEFIEQLHRLKKHISTKKPKRGAKPQGKKRRSEETQCVETT